MTDLDRVVWPVLRFGSPGCVMMKYSDGASLSRATVKGIQALNEMNEYFIVDSTGTRFDLEDAKPKDGRWGTLKRITLRIFNLIVEIRFGRITERGRLSLVEIKALVMRDIDANRDYWADIEEPQTLKARIEQARDVEGLFRLFVA